ncbi:MAG: hypothetical protein AAF223_03155 [Bacteroidota bacterium]
MKFLSHIGDTRIAQNTQMLSQMKWAFHNPSELGIGQNDRGKVPGRL